MYWEGKIDLLKQHFPPEEFRVPFSDSREIIQKIKSRFVNDAPWHPNKLWSVSLKGKTRVTYLPFEQVRDYLLALDDGPVYWVVVIRAGIQYVYHANEAATLHLAAMSQGDFFVVDKKYKWMLFFERAKDGYEVYTVERKIKYL